MKTITQELLKERLLYNDGEFYHLIGRLKGQKAGWWDKRKKSIMLKINQIDLLKHHMVYLYFNGYIPPTVFFKDGNRENYKIENLTESRFSDKDILDQKTVKKYYDYRDDGFLIWKESVTNLCKKGEIAGSKGRLYRQISVAGSCQLLHRMIFLWHNGFLPKSLDHKDGDKSNNRIENLRECTQSQNMVNRKKKPNTASKYKGVTLYKGKDGITYIASIMHLGKRTWLGRFKSERAAALTFLKESQKRHGGFVNFTK